MRKLSIWCGLLIGIGALACTTTGGVLGAVLFSFGLVSVICTGKRNLYTGWVGVCNFTSAADWRKLFTMLFLNSVGVALIAALAWVADVDLSASVTSIVEKRLQSTYLGLLCKSAITGIIMHICVWCAIRKETFIPTLIGVPLFILCGLPHCIADVFYYTTYAANGNFDVALLAPWAVSIVGNTIGCNIPRLIDENMG